MPNILFITFIGLLTGVVGTGIGGTVAFFFRRPSRRFLSIVLGFAGGLMIAIVCFDLLPEALNIAGLLYGIFGILMGVALVIFLDIRLPRINVYYNSNSTQYGFLRTGMLMGISVAIHNFPEGLAIGSGFMAANQLGIGLSIVIALHNMPEGMAMATPMSIGGASRIKVLLYTILAGIPIGIGAFLGALLGEISVVFIGICLSFAGGAMLYITCSELIPEAHNLHRGRVNALGIIAGIIGGIVISTLL